MSRATTSVGPAAANGTMILTGRSGYPGLCASAAVAKRSPAQAGSRRTIALVTPMVVSGPVPGIHVFLSRDGKEVDGRDKLGHDRDGIEVPVGDRLINERAE